MAAKPTGLWSRFRPVKLIDWLVVVAILGVVIAIFLPAVKSGSSGSINVPVKVIVFDAAASKPILGAQVVVVRQFPLEDSEIPEAFSAEFLGDVPAESRAITGENGAAVVRGTFRTEDNSNLPERVAILGNFWVIVSAEGYGGAVIPLRPIVEEVRRLREMKELVVPVGLLESP